MPKTSSKTKAIIAKKKKAFSGFLAVFEKSVELQATKANVETAKAIVEEAQEIIYTQRYRWKPLTEAYLDKKIAGGYDPRILIRTDEYVESLSWGKRGGKVWAGISPTAIHKDSGLPMVKLARIHEFGTKTVPSRQLWRPLLSKFIRNKSSFGKRYRKAVKNATKP